MNNDMNKRGLVVDHLIADEMNNTIANLSAMDATLNSKKKFVDRKILPPYYIIMAHKAGVYKAIYCFRLRHGTTFVNRALSFPGDTELIDGLKQIADGKVFGQFDSPRKHYKESDVTRYNLPEAYKLQKILYDNFDDDLIDIRIAEHIDSLNECE